MAPESDPQELYGLQTDNYHLKAMIGALREEMEKMRVSQEESIQHSLATAKDEIDQLKEMIRTLRVELERRKTEYEEECRTIEQSARDDVKQLHEMIRAMRDKLERYEKG